VRIFSLFAVLVAAAVAVGGSGAVTAKERAVAKIDVSTTSGVIHYLRSIHVNPRGVVIQRGNRNYAGPSCPGKGWACTHARKVVQIATGHGKNMFRCTAARCVIVQLTESPLVTNTAPVVTNTAPLVTNTAKCIRTTGITQSCSITQSSTGDNNRAIVYMNATKLTGLTQNASQTAQIVQTAGSGANTACVLQGTTIEGSTVARRGAPVSVNLNAHQTISITQDSASGGNTVQNATSSGGGDCAGGALDQSQTITSRAQGSASITQNQNTTEAGPNMVLDIAQNQSSGFFGVATGANVANFNQTNTLTAVANTSSTGSVNQTQSYENGGIVAGVNQDSRDVSTAVATQTETQCEDAHLSGGPLTCHTATPDPPGYPLTQTQFGPMRKGPGDSVQTGNENCVPSCNSFLVTQTSQQDNDTGSNQTNLIQGDCSTTGSCTVTQNTNINGTPSTNTQSGQNVDTQTTCSGSDCESTGPTTTGDLTLLPDGLSVSNMDIGEFGVGGMRGGSGTGSITVTGVTARVFHAFLYWNGPTNSADPDANADVTFAGSLIAGTNIGISGDNNWGFQNSQSYRADVTSLVTGNGTYSLANFTKLPDVDINGVALMVFYDNGNSGDDRNVVLWNGNDSNCLTGGAPESWDETINDVPYNGGAASLDLIVGDGQSFTDNEVDINGSLFIAEGQNFEGDSVPPNLVNGLWDVKSFIGLESFLSAASNDLHLTMTTTTPRDCLSLVVAAANVPVSGPIILAPTAAPTTAARARSAAPAPSVATGSGGASR
jgi:hypothetical protein